jgi:toxin-antitoxin system PIN domain toxin
VILPDVNVLIGAFRPEAEHHRRCHEWLQSIVNGPAAYGMSPQVLSSLIRIVTNPKLAVIADPVEKAFAFCDALLSHPHCQIIEPGPRHWSLFQQLCRASNARGNLVQDAWLAALAIESGCEWITLDRDFARFPGLQWREPSI